jgi:hypothetical protein
MSGAILRYFLDIISESISEFFRYNSTINREPNEKDELTDSLKTCKFTKSNDEEVVCPICLEEFNENETVIELSCKHIFHKDCIKKWFENNHSCPTCRKKIDLNSDNNDNTSDIFGNWINTFINSITNEVNNNRINDVLGARVTLYGILTQPLLNRETATIISHHRDDRYIVRLNSGRSISISIRNMTINRGLINESIINNINGIINNIRRENDISRIVSQIMMPGLTLTNILDSLYNSQFSNSSFNNR